MDFDTELQMSDADANLLDTGGEVASAIAEVSAGDPRGTQLDSALDKAAGELASRIVANDRAAAALSELKASARKRKARMRAAAFGVVEMMRYLDPELFSHVTPPTRYDQHDLLFFIDRTLSVVEAEPTGKFAWAADSLRRLRGQIAADQAHKAQVERDHETAHRVYEVKRSDFRKVLAEATSYVLEHARVGTAAYKKVKQKPRRVGKKAQVPAAQASAERVADASASPAALQPTAPRADPVVTGVVATAPPDAEASRPAITATGSVVPVPPSCAAVPSSSREGERGAVLPITSPGH